MYPTWYSHSISIIQYITYLPLFTQFTALSLGVFGATHHDLQHQLTYPTGPLEWSHQLTCPLNSHKQNWLVVYLHAGPLGTTGSDWIDKSEGYHLIRVTGWWLTYPSEKQSQLGWWHSQLMEKYKMFQTPNQIWWNQTCWGCWKVPGMSHYRYVLYLHVPSCNLEMQPAQNWA